MTDKRDQLTLLNELQDKGYNIVTCGDCGDVFIVDLLNTLYQCPHCCFKSEPCDFPDLYYQGWDNNKPVDTTVKTYLVTKIEHQYRSIQVEAYDKDEAFVNADIANNDEWSKPFDPYEECVSIKEIE